jgi:hypothetical protein
VNLPAETEENKRTSEFLLNTATTNKKNTVIQRAPKKGGKEYGKFKKWGVSKENKKKGTVSFTTT